MSGNIIYLTKVGTCVITYNDVISRPSATNNTCTPLEGRWLHCTQCMPQGPGLPTSKQGDSASPAPRPRRSSPSASAPAARAVSSPAPRPRRSSPSTTAASTTRVFKFDFRANRVCIAHPKNGQASTTCKCDPVYYGADCSLKRCKYGVDPLFYDNTDGAIHQTTVVHLGSVGGCTATVCTATNTRTPANLGGTFKLVFYDVFGEKYVTKALSAATALAPLTVQNALEALPNGVIANDNTFNLPEGW